MILRGLRFVLGLVSAIGVGAVVASGPVLAEDGKTLSGVKARGALKCGVHQGLPGFAATDDNGNWKGLDVDFCRAVAAAVFGDATKVEFVPLSAKERFTALQSGEIDLLSRNTTWTMTRDTSLGLNFAGVNYYDGQGFMVRKELGVSSALELSGASVCTNTGTTTELNVADYFKANKMPYEIVAFEKASEVNKAYDAARCDVYTSDASQLAAMRLKLAKPDDHMVLPEIISKEPLGPAVRQGDDQWFNVVRWTFFGLLNAEELGITKANVGEMTASDNPSVKRALGVDGDFGPKIGLDSAWLKNVVSSVGNYGEMYERHLGPKTPLAIRRGLNELWTKGGLMYAPPIR